VLTTATTHAPRPFVNRPFLQLVAGAYAALWLATALLAADVRVWALENVLPVPTALAIALAYPRWQLSDTSYLLCAIFLALHALGSQHGYAEVPAGDWLSRWLGSERNSYDRLVHLGFGLLMGYPIREMAMRVTGGPHLWASLFALAAVCALGALYEVAEWLVAAAVAPQRGAAFLGAQGDAWDAQKDMALAAGGALCSLTLVHLAHRRRFLEPHAPALARPSARALHAHSPRVHSDSAGPAQVAGPARLSSTVGGTRSGSIDHR
jgi:putative membrane protein